MSRRALGVLLAVLTATGCAQPTAHTTTSQTSPQSSPQTGAPSAGPPGFTVTDDGTGLDVCSLISAERMGDIYGASGVTATSAEPLRGSQLGGCVYTLGGLTVDVGLYPLDPTINGAAQMAEEFTYGKGTPIADLGDAAAVATYDDSDPKLADLAGSGRLVAVDHDAILVIDGPEAAVEHFEEVAREMWPRIGSLY
ncbi:hypothetical protein FXF51_34175 [Nonomuraea sp. PA05]|uniref:hypothetical protein n=1 Tax=Nonomuraea sp. PA05 TaxID=2604466 RepID=UPI0011D820E2|nr:hypothetical protein [Nonomuraea sp. PA05]TYB59520.1 hypothetical protein FXF51_34175 [Nonomuraea sp. PA05]